MTSIRPVTPADIGTILGFVRDLAEFEREPDAVVATEPMLHEALFERRVAEAVIAEIAGKPAGFALFFHNFSTWTGKPGLYLEDLYVTPEARGSGVGTALLRHLAGLALDRGCGRFEWAVLDWNAPAIDFYRAVGAVPMDEWTVQRVSGDALVKLAGERLMAYDQGLVDWVTEALEPIGTVTMRKMMGGATLYLDGTIFAIVDDGEIWFKSDAESNTIWDEAGCERFTMTFSDGKVDTMNYRRAPADVYDDPEAAREWASLGIAAGLRAPKKKPKKKA